MSCLLIGWMLCQVNLAVPYPGTGKRSEKKRLGGPRQRAARRITKSTIYMLVLE